MAEQITEEKFLEDLSNVIATNTEIRPVLASRYFKYDLFIVLIAVSRNSCALLN